MPCHQEGPALARTLEKVRARARSLGGVCVYLVDDGSDPPVVARQIPERSDDFRVVLARHVVNLGQGAALETARQLALREPHEVFVTMDADGQHDAADLAALARAIDGGADLALGNRFGGAFDPPWSRRALIHAARAFEAITVGARLSDAHNGFRAFSRRAIERLCLRQNRMAHATEIAAFAARGAERGLRVVEVPVSVRYTDATLAKGQRATGALAIVRDLLQRYLFEEPET
jgi:glycosyltransferase involved in cell wall biosynthesis